ncbi:MAG: phosphoribosylamine--glycine ligase [Desulfovibrio sp.]|nr:phosphoribosylamine--glycine ligase [Desulfovibrio sp.]
MRILVLGSGGREHALVWKLRQSPLVSHIFAAPGNPGTEAEGAENVPIAVDAIDALVDFAKREAIDLVVPGPELPLTLGITDSMRRAGIACFGPDSYCARLEGSKSYAKALMEKTGVPTAKATVVHTPEEAFAAIDRMGAPLVVKADGLAQGKGVVIAKTLEEARSAVSAMQKDRAFGSAGETVVLEEFLEGEEVSLLCFCDGTHIVPLPSAQDHKAAFDGDTGPNTGGMGAYSPCPLIADGMGMDVAKQTILPVVTALAKEGHPYVGVLYAGLMMTANGPKVLEYNVRFGDPECQPLLCRLESDLVPIMTHCLDGTLDACPIAFTKKAALGVVLAKEGYPGSYAKGARIEGIAQAEKTPNVTVFHSGTKRENGTLVSNGGRILCVTALGETIAESQKQAYAALGAIHCEGSFYRHDIGNKALGGK